MELSLIHIFLRDLTDTMYNPTSWPYINHFTANDRLVDHVERYVCPTMTSDQLLGGKPFRYGADKRPHLAIVVAEEGYGTKETLTKFAADQLGRDFRVSFVYGQADDARELPGLELLEDADLALFSVRRHVLKPEKMAIVRRFIAAGRSECELGRTAAPILRHSYDATKPNRALVAVQSLLCFGCECSRHGDVGPMSFERS